MIWAPYFERNTIISTTCVVRYAYICADVAIIEDYCYARCLPVSRAVPHYRSATSIELLCSLLIPMCITFMPLCESSWYLGLIFSEMSLGFLQLTLNSLSLTSR